MTNPLPVPISTLSRSSVRLIPASSNSAWTLPISRMKTVASAGDLARCAPAARGSSAAATTASHSAAGLMSGGHSTIAGLRWPDRRRSAQESLLGAARLDAGEELDRRFHLQSMTQCGQKMPAIVSDDHTCTRRPRDLGDVRVVDAAARNAVSGSGGEESQLFLREEAAHREPAEHLRSEQLIGIFGSQPELGRKA